MISSTPDLSSVFSSSSDDSCSASTLFEQQVHPSTSSLRLVDGIRSQSLNSSQAHLVLPRSEIQNYSKTVVLLSKF